MSRAEPVLFPFFFSRFAFLFSFTDLAGFFLVSFLVFLDFAINILLNKRPPAKWVVLFFPQSGRNKKER